MQTLGNMNKQNTFILLPPSKMKFSHTHIHFSLHFKILENNSFQGIIFLELFSRTGTLTALAKKLRDPLKLLHTKTNLHEY